MENLSSAGFWNPERAAGGLLLAALLVPILMLVVFSLRGELSEVFSQIGGLSGNRFVHNVSLTGWISASLLSLAGYCVMAVLLQRQGEQMLSTLALTGMVVTTVLLALEATIHLAFGAWAASELLRTGSEPAIYRVFFEWSSVILQRVYMPVGYISIMLLGWSIIQTAWLPAWAGWTFVAWGTGLIGLLLLLRTTLPATLLVPGAVVGVYLLARS